MCTLIAAVAQYRDFPLVIAANRDESLTRPASGPRLRAGVLPFVAPRDEQAGGTWLGLNAAGVFVGITNRFGSGNDPTRSSRGQLVVDALGAPTAAALHQQMRDVPGKKFNAFHLFYADVTGAYVTWSDGEQLHQEVLPSGLHVITERSYAVEAPRRVDRARSGWPKSPDGSSPPPAEIGELLAVHDDAEPLGALCVHVPAFNYGTRSSFVLQLSERLERSVLWSSDEAPCKTRPVARPELVAALVDARAR